MSESTPIRSWTHQPPARAVSAALARLARLADVAAVAAMPDVHLAGAVCIGAVIATRTRLIPVISTRRAD